MTNPDKHCPYCHGAGVTGGIDNRPCDCLARKSRGLPQGHYIVPLSQPQKGGDTPCAQNPSSSSKTKSNSPGSLSPFEPSKSVEPRSASDAPPLSDPAAGAIPAWYMASNERLLRDCEWLTAKLAKAEAERDALRDATRDLRDNPPPTPQEWHAACDERDDLRRQLDAMVYAGAEAWNRTCIHHTDAQRAAAGCPVCRMNALTEAQAHAARMREAVDLFVAMGELGVLLRPDGPRGEVLGQLREAIALPPAAALAERDEATFLAGFSAGLDPATRRFGADQAWQNFRRAKGAA